MNGNHDPTSWSNQLPSNVPKNDAPCFLSNERTLISGSGSKPMQATHSAFGVTNIIRVSQEKKIGIIDREYGSESHSKSKKFSRIFNSVAL